VTQSFEVESTGKTHKKQRKRLKKNKKSRGRTVVDDGSEAADELDQDAEVPKADVTEEALVGESSVFEVDHGLKTFEEDGVTIEEDVEPEIQSVISAQFFKLESSGSTWSQCLCRNFGCSEIVSAKRGQDLGVDGVVYINFIMLLSRLFACSTMVSLPLGRLLLLELWRTAEHGTFILHNIQFRP